jgi:flagellar motor switch protein FliM
VADVLSQSEIDALLEALSSGSIKVEEVISDEKKKKIKPYDFRRPNKLSKDQTRTLTMLHENFARLMTTALSTYLRTMVRAQVVSIGQMNYDEFVKSLHNPTVMCIFSLRPLDGNMVIEIQPQLAFVMVDRLLGGFGYSVEKIRELTDVEQTVMRRVMSRIIPSIKEAWQVVVELNPSFESIELNPLFTQIIPPTDMIVLITLEVRISEAFGLMNVCMPFAVIEPILDRLNAQVWFTRSSRQVSNPENTAALQNRLNYAQVPVVAELGRATITVGELLHMQVGDVLQLDQLVKGLLEVKVGNQLKFKGTPGNIDNRMAIQIAQIIREG